MNTFRIFMFLVIGTIGFGLTACGTIGGAGDDIESVGEAISDAAE